LNVEARALFALLPATQHSAQQMSTSTIIDASLLHHSHPARQCGVHR
jgi:hypothetical protein